VLAEQRHDAPSHFLGSVVLAPGPELAPSRSQWIIVDGRQRLTTLMLALCAIRDHLMAEDPAALERINELHLINKFQQGELRYRLLPTQADRTAFKACVDSTSEGKSDSLIGNAYQFFRGMLKEFDDPADPHDIARVESVLLDRLNLVQILVEKDDNAFRIFESINNTGMRLSQVDSCWNRFMASRTPALTGFSRASKLSQKLLAKASCGTRILRSGRWITAADQGYEATSLTKYVCELSHPGNRVSIHLDRPRALRQVIKVMIHPETPVAVLEAIENIRGLNISPDLCHNSNLRRFPKKLNKGKGEIPFAHSVACADITALDRLLQALTAG
jgi:hypothetical protein